MAEQTTPSESLVTQGDDNSNNNVGDTDAAADESQPSQSGRRSGATIPFASGLRTVSLDSFTPSSSSTLRSGLSFTASCGWAVAVGCVPMAGRPLLLCCVLGQALTETEMRRTKGCRDHGPRGSSTASARTAAGLAPANVVVIVRDGQATTGNISSLHPLALGSASGLWSIRLAQAADEDEDYIAFTDEEADTLLQTVLDADFTCPISKLHCPSQVSCESAG
eukprot:scaffold912_cov422-Prasinococcus_capsulatus_cf.AAC.21